MSPNTITIEAIFENGVLRPVQALSLPQHQRVTLTLTLPTTKEGWPDNVAEIYREIAQEDQRLSEAMFHEVHLTWPGI
jgi:predicted DNA-binding antitoxin AbrB/MazE fold protein